MVNPGEWANASRNETKEILSVYLVNRSALYKGVTDQDDV